MDPNAWKRHALNLRHDLGVALRDQGSSIRMLTLLRDLTPQGRQVAWDTVAAPVFQQAIDRRPKSARRVRLVMGRLWDVFQSGSAAETPARLQEVLNG